MPALSCRGLSCWTGERERERERVIVITYHILKIVFDSPWGFGCNINCFFPLTPTTSTSMFEDGVPEQTACLTSSFIMGGYMSDSEKSKISLGIYKKKEPWCIVVVVAHRHNVPHKAFCQEKSPIHFLSANVVPTHLHKCRSVPSKMATGLTLESSLSQMISESTENITVLSMIGVRFLLV